MTVLRNLTMDNLINLYEGIVVHDRQSLSYASTQEQEDLPKRVLAQDKMILGALKCAKHNGFIGGE